MKTTPFFALAIAMVIFGCSHDTPKPVADSSAASKSVAPTAVPAFDKNRAFAHLLKQTSFGPRNPNSKGHSACLEYLLTTLRGVADEVRLQEFNHNGYNGEFLHLTNVIASWNPNATSRVLLLAHWDTRPRADQDEDRSRRNEPILGANDGASGVAVLLELATLFHAQHPAIGVDILLVDGEDYGMEGDRARYLLGARYFADNLAPGYQPKFGILLDMVGDAFLELPQEQSSLRFAPDIVALVWRTAAELGFTQFINGPGEEIMDDHLPLNQVGIKTIDLIDFNYPDQTNRYWHTHQDTPDHCSAESLEAVGTVLAHVVYRQTP